MNSILIIDDDRMICALVKRNLEKSGYQVYVANDGDQAIRLLQNTAIDLVLLDQVMPGADGLETYEKIKKRISASLPVIMETAMDSTHLAVESMRRGVVDFIVKPFDFDILKIKIERVLKETSEKKRKEEALRQVHRCSFQNYTDSEEMIGTALSAVANLMGMNVAFMGKINDDIIRIEHCIYCQGNIGLGQAFQLKDIFYSDADKLTIPLYIADAAKSIEWKNHPIYTKLGFSSYIGIPIIIKEKFYGIFCLGSESPRQYDESSLEITRLFAQKVEREIEKEIIQQELLEAQTLSSMSRMTAAIAHEMRQPLTSADMDLAGVLEMVPKESDAHELLLSARSRVKDALHVIRFMMKIYRGKGEKLPDLIDINQDLNDTIALFGNRCNGVEIVRNFSSDARITTSGNLSRIFVNLVDNALEALDNSGKLILGSRKEEEKIIVTIEDSGRGIPPDVLSKVFEPEFTTKKTGEGTGLGLWIAKQEVNRIGGKITVESEAGKYTRFSVTLPINIK